MGNGFHTSEIKVIDNVIIGYILKKKLKKSRSDLNLGKLDWDTVHRVAQKAKKENWIKKNANSHME